MKALFRHWSARVLLFLFITLMFLYIAISWLTPLLAVELAKSWYSEQGNGYELKVRNWQLSALSGELVLKGVKATHPGQLTGNTEAEEIRLDIDLASLKDKILHIQEIAMSGIELAGSIQRQTAEKGNQNLLLAGVIIPLTSSAEGKDSQPEETVDNNKEDWILILDTLSITNNRYQFNNADINVDATINKVSLTGLNTDSKITTNKVPVDIRLTVNSLSLKQPQAIVTNQPIDIQWQGQLEDIIKKPSATGSLSVNNFSMKVGSMPGIFFESLTLKDIKADQDSQSVKNLLLENLSILSAEERDQSEEARLATLASYHIADISISLADSMNIQTGVHSYQNLLANITLLKGGKIKGMEPGNKTGEKTAEVPPLTVEKESATDVESKTEDVRPEQAGQPLTLSIAGIQQKGEEGSSFIHFSNKGIDPEHQGKLVIRKLNVGAMNIHELDQGVDFDLLLSSDEYNSIHAEGKMGLKGDDPEGNAQLIIEQLNLVDLNGYIAQAIGYHAKKGMLDLDIKVEIKDGKVIGTSDILLRNSEFVPVDEATIDRVSKQISMPVDTALSVLRDDSNNIKLNVPIEGDLNNPEFGLQDLRDQITTLALKKAAMYYLKQSLQPYGTLISLATFAGDHLFAISLDPLKYRHFVYELSEEQKDYLQKVVDIMQRKEALELQVCGFVNQHEVEAINKKRKTEFKNWQELAQLRSKKVKAYLSKLDKNKTDDKHALAIIKRVSLCKPQKDEEAQVLMGF